MDPIVAAFGTALVGAIATDAWQRVREAVAGLWRRVYPQREYDGIVAELDELREQLRRDPFGGLFEDKPNAVVMHWRGHSIRQAKLIEQKTRALFEPAAQVSGLSLLEFEAGVELRVGRDKGGAVEAIVEQAEREAPVVYVGDDLTDESAFCAVNRLRNPHLSVLMRRVWRETAAEVWLQPPDGLRWFLREWEKAVNQPGESYQRFLAAG